MRSQETGSIGFFDEATGQARWLVDEQGRLGINTTKPTSTLTVDGYIESTKGFLVNGRPVGGVGLGLPGGRLPLYLEGPSNSFFGTNAGNGSMTGTFNSFFGVDTGNATTTGAGNTFAGWGAGKSNASGNDNSIFGAGAGINTTASNNAFFGQNAGNQNTSGGNNSFFGKSAGEMNTATGNSAFGYSAGKSNTTGAYNAFFGLEAGSANTTQTDNSFFGAAAGKKSTGYQNSFFGSAAGRDNTTGSENCFFGTGSGGSITTASKNSFFGAQTGGFYGSENCFFGAYSGNVNLGGNDNAFVGYYAGQRNHTGSDNAFVGAYAGTVNDSGYNNVFVGRDAGVANSTGFQNSFIGYKAGQTNTVQNNNTLVGGYADLDGSTASPITNATAIGYRSYVSRSNSLVLGGVNGLNNATTETFVGIGTSSPDRQLVVEGSQAIGKFRRFNATGLDFGPAFLFERARGTNITAADIVPGDYLGKVQFRGRVGGNMPEYGAFVFVASDTSQNGRFSFVDRDLVTERMVILNTGKVGIGTNAPTEALDVAGNLRVRGGILYGAPAVSIPDYVFEPDYRLLPLADLWQYVKTEKHLPNIPSAAEIDAAGVNLGEFQMKLLAKVEELTLYAVQQEQANTSLREEAAALKERVKALEEMVKALVERDKSGR